MFLTLASRTCFPIMCKLSSISNSLSMTSLVTNCKYLHISSQVNAKLYSEKHEWVELVENSSDEVRVGITKYAADALGDVVFAQLPEVGEVLESGDECGALESVKAASELYSPVSGTVSGSNARVEDKPALINTSAEESAWLFQLQLSKVGELASLMDKEKYQKYLQSVTDDLD